MNNQAQTCKLKNRREFLKSAARKAVIPVVAAYTIKKSTPNLFASY
jgi:hypothetical protein